MVFIDFWCFLLVFTFFFLIFIVFYWFLLISIDFLWKSFGFGWKWPKLAESGQQKKKTDLCRGWPPDMISGKILFFFLWFLQTGFIFDGAHRFVLDWVFLSLFAEPLRFLLTLIRLFKFCTFGNIRCSECFEICVLEFPEFVLFRTGFELFLVFFFNCPLLEMFDIFLFFFRFPFFCF